MLVSLARSQVLHQKGAHLQVTRVWVAHLLLVYDSDLGLPLALEELRQETRLRDPELLYTL